MASKDHAWTSDWMLLEQPIEETNIKFSKQNQHMISVIIDTIMLYGIAKDLVCMAEKRT